MRQNITLAFIALFFTAHQATAALVLYKGLDPNVNASQPRPNSIAAAAAFDAAVLGLGGSTSILTFEDAPPGDFTTQDVGLGVICTLGGTGVFAPATGTDFIGITTGFPESGNAGSIARTNGFNTTAGGSLYLSVVAYFNLAAPNDPAIAPATATFDFPSPVSAFGAYLTGVGTGIGTSMSLNFDDGTGVSLPITGATTGGVQFFGVIDAGKSISSIRFQMDRPNQSTRDIFGIDDLRFTVVPEPSTIALATIGAAALGCFAVRRRRAA